MSGLNQRFIGASETITEEKKEKFTFADKKVELASAEQAVLGAHLTYVYSNAKIM